MLRFKYLLLICLVTYINFYSCAQAYEKFVPSVWVWKAESTNRIVYLIGEQHQFIADKTSLRLDHKLGQDVYALSNKVYIESMQKNSTDYDLKLLLSESNIKEIKDITHKLINSISSKDVSEKNKLVAEQITDLLKSNPISAYSNLIFLSSLKYIVDSNFSLMVFNGLTKVLKDKEKSISLNMRKLISIENDTLLASYWENNCNSAENAKIIIQAALNTANSNSNFSKSNFSKAQNIFSSNDTSIDDVMANFLSSQEGLIFLECVVTPRNLKWTADIKDELNTSGPPIAIIAGIAHMGGKSGLIELLRKEGYTDIKRIYNIK